MSQIKVELQETMGSDKSVADAAWTSSIDYQKKKTRTDKDVERVVKMLAENRHSTPFESVIFRFWIKMPIAIDRQFMTHRIQSANGMSGRYRTMPNEFLPVPHDVIAILLKLEYGKYEADQLIKEYTDVCEKANWQYNEILTLLKEDRENGFISDNDYKRCREFFRGMLPQHNMTERVSIMNLRAFANFQKLRNSPHAQPEIQEVARGMLDAVKKANVAPIAIEWLEKNEWNI